MVTNGNYKILLFALLFMAFNRSYAQAPNISYLSPQKYTYAVGTGISPLIPINKGGAVPPAAYGQVSTFAGSGSSGSADGQGTAAGFNAPRGMTVDNNNNIYVADRGNNKIREITPQGLVSTYAGSGLIGEINATGKNASFTTPSGITIDASGNMYVADAGNQLIRKITPNGAVSTYAGSGFAGTSDGTKFASFDFPNDVVADNAGNVYVSDYNNEEIRMIAPGGVVSTLAGYPSIGSIDGTGSAARFYNPGGLAIDAAGNICVTDIGNNLIRKVTPAGVVTTYAGSGSSGFANGTGAAAGFNYPASITIDQLGNLYVADTFNALIRKIDPAGVVTTFAGIAQTTGFTNGDRLSATFNQPFGIVADKTGDLYVADAGNFAIRKISLTGYTIDKPLPAGLIFNATTGTISGTPTESSQATDYTITAYNLIGSSSTVVNIAVNATAAVNSAAPNITYQTPQVYTLNIGITPLAPTNTGGAVPANIYGQVSTIAGNGSQGSVNGPAAASSFSFPYGIVLDANNNIYVADVNNNLIRKITPAGVVSTFAGSGATGNTNGTGTAASFFGPSGLAIDNAGNIYVADQGNNMIRKITPAGLVSTLAGSGALGDVNGAAASASFTYPRGIAVDKQGDVYISDSDNLIREISAAGIVSTFAGSGAPGSADGPGSSASFNLPDGLAIDADGNIYVADEGGNNIRKITPAGVVSTIAGNGQSGSSNGNGQALTASFNTPLCVTVDPCGDVYAGDVSAIRKITPSGTISTLAGTLGSTGSANGIRQAASFNGLFGLAYDHNGNMYVADGGNFLIRKIIATGYDISGTLPAGLSFDPATGIISGKPTVISPATDYTVTAYNAAGCSSTVINIAVVDALTMPPIPDKTICDADFDPGAVSLSGAITYTSSNLAVATIVAGKIHIVGPGTSTITANDGTTSQSQVLTVEQPVIPTITITPSEYSSCVGLSLTYTATITNGGINPTYQWKVNGQPAGTNSNTFTSTTLQTGDMITCTLTNYSDCTTGPVVSNTASLTADAYTTPTVSIQSSATGAVAAGTAITFTATPTYPGSAPLYQWSVNGNVVANDSLPVFTTTCLNNGDNVNCRLANQGGACLTALYVYSNYITANIIDPPSLTISASANNVYAGTAVTFTASVAHGTASSYQWQVNNKNAGTNSATFTSNTLKNGDVVTCNITTGNCMTPITSNQIQMTVLPPLTVFIPNTFTPNGDGINDLWDIPALISYPNCMVDVYSRYGALILHSVGYSKAWDGTYKGSKLPVGTYYYVIDLGNKTPKLSGYIALIK